MIRDRHRIRRRLLACLAAACAFALAALAAGGIYLFGVKRYHVANLGHVRHFDVIRGYLLDPTFRRLVHLVEHERTDPERGHLRTVFDTTDDGVALSRTLFRPVEMFGTMTYAYKANAQNIAFRARTGTFHAAFEMEDSPAVRAALPELNLTHLATASYDEHGFRRADPELTRECQARALFLGDSFTDGLWVNDSDTFVTQYGWLVRQRAGLRMCPVNAGVSGYGSLEEAYVLEHSFDVVGRPHLVVVMHYANDVDHDEWAVVTGGLPDAERQWEDSLSYLRRMAAFSKRRNATLVVAAIPTKDQFADLSTQRHYGDRLRLFGRREDIVVIDLLDSMKQYNVDDLYWSWDSHFTPFGHKVVAEILYQQTKELLTECCT